MLTSKPDCGIRLALARSNSSVHQAATGPEYPRAAAMRVEKLNFSLAVGSLFNLASRSSKSESSAFRRRIKAGVQNAVPSQWLPLRWLATWESCAAAFAASDFVATNLRATALGRWGCRLAAVCLSRENIASRTGDWGHASPNAASAPPEPIRRPPGCRFAPRCRYAAPACAIGIPPLTDQGAGHTAACIRIAELASA